MRAYVEKLDFAPDSTLKVLNRRLEEGIPFQWHHHPVYELTLTLNSIGQRYIGDHIGDYGAVDLVLVGPNLPHTWFSQGRADPTQPHIALVIWFHADLAKPFAELRDIDHLLQRAVGGLHFPQDTAAEIRPDFERCIALPPRERLIAVLSILARLADSTALALSTAAVLASAQPEAAARIDRVLTRLNAHYAQDIRLAELADLAATSLSGLHRLFYKHTGKTISAYLTQMRIGDACARLAGSTQPIAHIASEVGYGTLANFNRQFKALKAMTPRQYRDSFKARR